MHQRFLKIRVEAPATSANVGAAYDCAAFALDLWNSFDLYVALESEALHENSFEVRFKKTEQCIDGDTFLSKGENLFIKAFNAATEYVCDKAHIKGSFRHCFLQEEVHIPPVRGLGSSASACVAGTIAAWKYLQHEFPDLDFQACGADLSNVELVATLASHVDVCPDNICASLAGGLTIALQEDAKPNNLEWVHFFKEKFLDEDLRAIVLVPRNRLFTRRARLHLAGQSYKIEDVAYNLARAAWLPRALMSKEHYYLLKEVTKDRIHQTQRRGLYGETKVVNLSAIFDHAIQAGAYCAYISGAGSSLMALADVSRAEQVSQAMAKAFKDNSMGTGWQIENMLNLRLTNAGAHAVCEPWAWSIADDTDLRLWSLGGAADEQRASGHPKRPLAITDEAVKDDAFSLIQQLRKIPTGAGAAQEYVDIVFRSFSLIFQGQLTRGTMEQNINQGRKRVDITFFNAAESGFFFQLQKAPAIPCRYVFVECKNYAKDPANPELDQLQGRLSEERGLVGILACRAVKDQHAMLQRCLDAKNNESKYLFVMTDVELERLLTMRAAGDDRGINNMMLDQLQELSLSSEIS